MLWSVIGCEKLLEIRQKAGLIYHGGILENGTRLMQLKISFYVLRLSMLELRNRLWNLCNTFYSLEPYSRNDGAFKLSIQDIVLTFLVVSNFRAIRCSAPTLRIFSFLGVNSYFFLTFQGDFFDKILACCHITGFGVKTYTEPMHVCAYMDTRCSHCTMINTHEKVLKSLNSDFSCQIDFFLASLTQKVRILTFPAKAD